MRALVGAECGTDDDVSGVAKCTDGGGANAEGAAMALVVSAGICLWCDNIIDG